MSSSQVGNMGAYMLHKYNLRDKYGPDNVIHNLMMLFLNLSECTSEIVTKLLKELLYEDTLASHLIICAQASLSIKNY